MNTEENWVLTDKVKSLRPVIDTDHPLSLGYKVFLASDSQYVDEEFRLTTDELLEYAGPGCELLEGMHAVYTAQRRLMVVIRGSAADGKKLPLTRIIELIVHEVSHLVDGFFERAYLESIDTELRAYYNDWIVGKFLHHFNIDR